MSRTDPGNERPRKDPARSADGSEEERSLEALLRVLGSTPEGNPDPNDLATTGTTEHVDPVDLGEWLDGVAAESVRTRVEGHLAACGECRDLARQVGSAPVLAVEGEVVLADAPDRRARRRARLRARRRRQVWGLAAAAVFTVLAVGLLRSSRVDPRLGSTGVGLWARAVADRDLLHDAGELLDRGWPEVPALAELPGPEGLGAAAPIRGSRVGVELLEPRWEAVRTGRPVLRWSSSPAMELDSIVLIDGDDNMVGRFAWNPSAQAEEESVGDGVVVTWTWPETADALDPGGVYAWKVNLRDPRGDGVASTYVPFRVLDRDEAETLGRRLVGWGGPPPPFLAALELARRGVYSEARRQLAEAPSSPRVDELVLALETRQHLVEPGRSDAGSGGEGSSAEGSGAEIPGTETPGPSSRRR